MTSEPQKCILDSTSNLVTQMQHSIDLKIIQRRKWYDKSRTNLQMGETYPSQLNFGWPIKVLKKSEKSPKLSETRKKWQKKSNLPKVTKSKTKGKKMWNLKLQNLMIKNKKCFSTLILSLKSSLAYQKTEETQNAPSSRTNQQKLLVTTGRNTEVQSNWKLPVW